MSPSMGRSFFVTAIEQSATQAAGWVDGIHPGHRSLLEGTVTHGDDRARRHDGYEGSVRMSSADVGVRDPDEADLSGDHSVKAHELGASCP
jgi:hypothetical protein